MRSLPAAAVTAAVALMVLCAAAACGSSQSPRAGQTRSALASPAASASGAASASAAPARAAKRGVLINGVWCATTTTCVAVGFYYYSQDATATLVERWTGKAWRRQPSPDPARFSTLDAVSCPASTECVATGSPAVIWTGTTWRVTALPAVYTAISCTGPDFCVAVGGGFGSAGVYAVFNGRSWQTGRLPSLLHPSQSSPVAAVSCTSPVFCVAVGDYSYGAMASPTGASFRDKTLAVAWNGRAWQLMRTVNTGPVDSLTGVSCTAPDACVAVGTTAQQFPLAERWNGQTWQTQPLPVPGQIGYTQLTAISCVSQTTCVAVGTYQDMPLAETWTGTRWLLHWLPVPADAQVYAQVTAVSCASTVACVAVGMTRSQGFAERFDGLRWLLTSIWPADGRQAAKA